MQGTATVPKVMLSPVKARNRNRDNGAVAAVAAAQRGAASKSVRIGEKEICRRDADG